MGMEVRMVMEAPDEATARRAAGAAFARIAALDARLSDYRPDSDLRAIEGAAPERLRVHPEVYAVIVRAVEVARATGGAFDPTVAPVVALWRESRQSGRLPPADRLTAARALVDWSRVELDNTSGGVFVRLPVAGMRLDLGGIAKGYILQRALDTLREQGVSRAMIEAGGDIVAGDPPAGSAGWRVAISAACVVRGAEMSAQFAVRGTGPPGVWLRNEALATSGATAQFVEIDGVRYSHVVDPQTGLGLTGHRTVHVRAKDGATADAWATALSVMAGRGIGDHTALLSRVPKDVQFCVTP